MTGYQEVETRINVPQDWEVKTIDEICYKPQYGYTQSAIEEPIGPKFLRISDIQDGKVEWAEVPFCYCPNETKEKYSIQPGDIFVARTGATTGKSYLIKENPEAVFASYLIRIRTKKGTLPEFLFYFFNSNLYWKQVRQKMGGSAQGGLNASLLSKLIVPKPSCDEQRIICGVLSAVDETIGVTAQQVEKYTRIKQGLMQDLFELGVDYVGRIRSKNTHLFKQSAIGELPDEWTLARLGKLLSLEYGAGLPESNRFSGKYPVFGSNGIIGYHNQPLVEGPGIIVGRKGSIGEVWWSESDFWPIDTTYYVLRKQKETSLKWLYYKLKQSNLEKLNSATGVPGLNRDDAYSVQLALPSPKEQQKIDLILSNIDEAIKNEIAYKEKLFRLKNGLIDDLLSGTVRVNRLLDENIA